MPIPDAQLRAPQIPATTTIPTTAITIIMIPAEATTTGISAADTVTITAVSTPAVTTADLAGAGITGAASMAGVDTVAAIIDSNSEQ